jgi:hypothetical protein
MELLIIIIIIGSFLRVYSLNAVVLQMAVLFPVTFIPFGALIFHLHRDFPVFFLSSVTEMYSQLPSTSEGRLLHPRPEDAPCHGDWDSHDHYIVIFP